MDIEVSVWHDGNIFYTGSKLKDTGFLLISFRKANDREARKYGRPKILDE
jgi:uncharacterized DUF497 family protein